jgi:magnesium-transporting ATPase (P-type)
MLVAHSSYSDSEWEQIKTKFNNFESESDREAIESNLIVVGIFGLMDPLRPGIREAVK